MRPIPIPTNTISEVVALVPIVFCPVVFPLLYLCTRYFLQNEKFYSMASCETTLYPGHFIGIFSIFQMFSKSVFWFHGLTHIANFPREFIFKKIDIGMLFVPRLWPWLWRTPFNRYSPFTPTPTTIDSNLVSQLPIDFDLVSPEPGSAFWLIVGSLMYLLYAAISKPKCQATCHFTDERCHLTWGKPYPYYGRVWVWVS